jgi:hypothetical protein
MQERRDIQASFQKLMKKVSEIDRNKSGPRCSQCWYYQPKFRYRRCLYATCPYGKGNEAVFRKKPLGKENYPKRKES